MEQLEDGQALVGCLVFFQGSNCSDQGMVPLLVLGQWVDPRIVQQVLGDTDSEVPAGMMQRVATLQPYG